MNPVFDEIFQSPENSIFKVVFYPDRIYHARYLNATRSSRYRYNVTEVRSYLDIVVMKGQVYLDGVFYCNMLRVEYGGTRIVELTRERGRLHRGKFKAWIKMHCGEKQPSGEVTLHYCPWTDTFQVEIWGTLEPPANNFHDYQVLDQMGHEGTIVAMPAFTEALTDLKSITKVECAFAEPGIQEPAGWLTDARDIQWDSNFLRSHQEPNNPQPSSSENTVEDKNYMLDFQRGWFLSSKDIAPVSYRNAMMDGDNSERRDDNVVHMRWIRQREFGGSMVFFHEVEIPPGTVEGTHQHIGTEELYYITQGEGIAYMRDGDDPATNHFPLVEREVMGVGIKQCRELPVTQGNVIFTKSGGIHGIRNNSTKPLKFVAFLYHTT